MNKYREHIVDGLENAPKAFIGMLEGKNFTITQGYSNFQK
jgi:NADPH-dependent curcumin reductase CurA